MMRSHLSRWTHEVEWVRRDGRQGSDGIFVLFQFSSSFQGRELDSVCSSSLDFSFSFDMLWISFFWRFLLRDLFLRDGCAPRWQKLARQSDASDCVCCLCSRLFSLFSYNIYSRPGNQGGGRSHAVYE